MAKVQVGKVELWPGGYTNKNGDTQQINPNCNLKGKNQVKINAEGKVTLTRKGGNK